MALALAVGLALLAAGCESDSEPRTCNMTVALRDEISDELSAMDEAKSQVASAAGEVESMLLGATRRSNVALEEIHALLQEIESKLEMVHDELESKEVSEECEVK